LNIVKGYRLEFSSLPIQNVALISNFSPSEEIIVQDCIDKLLSIGAIEKAKSSKNQWISKIFPVPKSDGTFRLILNLKQLNEFIPYEHFIMEDYRSVCNILLYNMYGATIDLMDAYHLVPIEEKCRVYLRFKFKNILYQYTCLPFGLASAPRIFTKLLKPVVAHLREQGKFTCNIFR
jgi:Reverse transcriptase (RNA-dependent DNA polymerase)